MDIKDLNKKQMILLVLLVCFVVSIATGIVTVSLMQQVPKSVPQTINRVIERTITNVTSTPVTPKNESSVVGDANAVVQIFNPKDVLIAGQERSALGTGVIISDVGLVLVDNNILGYGATTFEIEMEKDMYKAEVLQKFSNGFTILKILPKDENSDTTKVEDNKTDKDPVVDIKQ